MTPGRWGQLDELYHAVRSLPPSERNALLERADPELRATVLSILAHEGVPENGDAPQPEAFLDRPAWEGRSSLLQHSGSSDAERLVNAGEQLGPYRIEQKIGQGGMGTVYRATDTRLDRSVALKISRKLFDDRLEREARAISSLNHPHICTLHDIGPDYIVMEFVEGETLAARIGKGALPVSDVLRYGAQIAGALAAAHDKDITHRDLKPANVMITKNGVKVLDFGLAKRSTPDGTLTMTGAVMGTPAYMAPEQRKGHDGRRAHGHLRPGPHSVRNGDRQTPRARPHAGDGWTPAKVRPRGGAMPRARSGGPLAVGARRQSGTGVGGGRTVRRRRSTRRGGIGYAAEAHVDAAGDGRGWCSRRRRPGLGVILESLRLDAGGAECFAPPASGYQLPFRPQWRGWLCPLSGRDQTGVRRAHARESASLVADSGRVRIQTAAG